MCQGIKQTKAQADNEVALLTKAKKGRATNKDFEPILKKLVKLVYLAQVGRTHFLYILTPKLRISSPVMRALMGEAGNTMKFSKAEYKYLCQLMNDD